LGETTRLDDGKQQDVATDRGHHPIKGDGPFLL